MAADTNIQLIDLNNLYPVGCVYITATNINPNTFLKLGNWSLIGNGRMIMGADSSDKGLETGGSMSKSVPLLAHTHSFTPSGSVSSHTHTGPSHSHTGTTSNSGAHAHTGLVNAEYTKGTNKNGVTTSGTSYTGKVLTNSTGGHTHTFTTAASGTGATGASTPTFTGSAGTTGSTGTANVTMDVTNSYIKLFIWQRTA